MSKIRRGNGLNLEWHSLDCLNWPEEYPYKPEVKFAAWHDGACLHLHFSVEEGDVRAECTEDRQPIWNDACVEFFFAPRGDGIYYNLECNSLGKIYLCRGRDRNEREHLSEEDYSAVKRTASSVVGGRWEMKLDIPASIYGLGSFDGLRAKGNFYKCGNKCQVPHFLSYAPIATPKPDFHRPEFFTELEFEDLS